ncbi:thioredoxin family protein [Uliginosibacterium sp. H1]|uniref:thioredoxin family protein n=1 Tax=Uliginosibacterium sp. H1 TaxID=3114757 RepID=UPI002E17D1D3|nr:thioredoxin family protein [Uliginosibacterium sp. H1]
MTMQHSYAAAELTRAELDALPGPTVVEFGAPWCGHCRAAQAPLEIALAQFPDVRHIKIEDGKGRKLGRSFAVKLWPTLVFINAGAEEARLVRPTDAATIRQALERLKHATV